MLEKLIATLILVTSFTAFANQGTEPEKWTCVAQGKTSFGGPVGDIWQTVTGDGPSQYQAVSDAHSNCVSQGLESCVITNCYQH